MLQLLINAVSYIVPFMALVTIVAFFHELGHFLVARWCGVKIETFSVGFGPEMFARMDGHGTRWRVGAIPFGGYVKFHQDSMPDPAKAASREAGSFAAQPLFKRAAIVAAGPLANIFLAIVVLTGNLAYFGHPVWGPRIGTVVVGSAADDAGLKVDDVVISVGGRPTPDFPKVLEAFSRAADGPVHLVVRRGEREVTFDVRPQWRELEGPNGKARFRIGIVSSNASSNIRHAGYGPVESVTLASAHTWQMMTVTGAYLMELVSGRESADRMTGPIGIAQLSHDSAREAPSLGLLPFLNLVAMLSVSVGLFNLLPVPLLDGGHLAFFSLEALFGRPVGERAQDIGARFGLATVGALLIFSTYNDFVRLLR